MSVTPEVRELAAKTAAHLRVAGWLVGDYSDSYAEEDLADCPKCVVGAARYVQTGNPGVDPEDEAAEQELFEAIYQVLPKPIRDAAGACEGAVTKWNDAAASVDEVLAVLDGIAAGAVSA